MVPNYGARLRLIERLGAGGMAQVWKAEMLDVPGFVAVKRILPEYAGDGLFRQMFMQEARISSRLAHPNLVRVFDFGEVGGDCFLAMEFLDGKNLYDVIVAYLRKKQYPPPGLAAYVTHRLCSALGHAHALTDESGNRLGLVHRDVSPGNVMLTFDGEVKLLDFGIAKLLEDRDHRTETGVVKGKSAYMAPERLASLPIDQRADLFSAGVFLHETLCGRRLFPTAEPGTVVDTLFDRAVATPPSQFNPAVPVELDAICRRALARDAVDRFPDGAAMAAELEAVLSRLEWGPDEAAAAVRELFARAPEDTAPTQLDNPYQPTHSDLGEPSSFTHPDEPGPPPPTRPMARETPSVTQLPKTVVSRRRIPRWTLIPALAFALGGVGWWLHSPAPVPVSVSAPVPVPAPVPVSPPVPVPVVPVPVPVPVKTAPPTKRKHPHHTAPAAPPHHANPLNDSELASPF